MSEFAMHIYRAIGQYRHILRRYLSQVDRMKKLDTLGLKLRLEETSEATFYRVAENILADMGHLLEQRPASYYSYSGVEQFGAHLKQYLSQYELTKDGRVVHLGQLSAKAFLEAVQLLRMPIQKMGDQVPTRLAECQQILIKHADKNQCLDYFKLLQEAELGKLPWISPLAKDFKQALCQQRGIGLDDGRCRVA